MAAGGAAQVIPVIWSGPEDRIGDFGAGLDEKFKNRGRKVWKGPEIQDARRK
jgi:hypothetical protein